MRKSRPATNTISYAGSVILRTTQPPESPCGSISTAFRFVRFSFALIAGASLPGPEAPVRLSRRSRCLSFLCLISASEIAVAPDAQMLLSRMLRKCSFVTLHSTSASAVAPSGPMRLPSRSSFVMLQLLAMNAESTIPPSTSHGSQASTPRPGARVETRVRVVARICESELPFCCCVLEESLRSPPKEDWFRMFAHRSEAAVGVWRLRLERSRSAWLRALLMGMGPRILIHSRFEFCERTCASSFARSTPMVDLERSMRVSVWFI
mmetsp:Transcript_56629/g.115951  ORF Transcript_56629/g.115951 Transcript_56629/m.115951 type:complete len:265 (+) Transcript_56629:3105-3899(+)